jgi:tetratricopeptide (TPR) repeat protein
MSQPPVSPSKPRWTARADLVALAFLAAASLAWSSAWRAPFVFDDTASILENRSIRELTSCDWLYPPHGAGETVSGRPVLNFTFALNYALGGLDVRGYRALNLLIHVAAALTLFGIVRRTTVGGRRDDWLAIVIAALWLLHPLQTESVTYVVQRAEALVGLFSLLTLYCFIRGATTNAPATAAGRLTPRGGWLALSLLSCLLGVGTKETMVTVPVLVLCYDRTFIAGSFAAAWRMHRRYYLLLASTWMVLVALVMTTGGDRGGTFQFGNFQSWTDYWFTQFEAVFTYLRLALWPAPLVFEYGTSWVSDPFSVAHYAVVVLTLGIAAIVALRHWPTWGFLGLWFFGLLAPTSVLPGTIQMIVEHRTYLPIAAVITAAVVLSRSVLGNMSLPRWAPGVLAAVAVIAAGSATFARNQVYASDVSLWGDTVAKRPDNPRARYNFGVALAQAGRSSEAEAQFLRVIALQPNHAFAHFELGKAAMLAGRWSEAATRFGAALQADPHFVDARVNQGHVLARLGKVDEAIAHYRAALAAQPAVDIQVSLAALLVQIGRLEEAAPLLQRAVIDAPDLPEAHYQWARLRERAGDLAAAENALRTALRLRPDFGAAALTLGNLLGRRGRYAEAIDQFRTALAAEPANTQARNNLANCFLALGRFAEAIAEYERILQTRPNDAAVRQNLEIARQMQRQR